MDADEKIHEAGLVLVVFNESGDILEKDLQLFEDVLAQKEVLAEFRHVSSIPILERMGHRLCTAAVWPTSRRGGWSHVGTYGQAMRAMKPKIGGTKRRRTNALQYPTA